MPGCSVYGRGAYNPAHLCSLAVLLPVREFGERKKLWFRKHSLAQHAKLCLANDRSELAGPSYSFNLDELAEDVGILWGDAALDIDPCSCVLHNEVGCWSIHRNDAPNQHWIAKGGFFRAQTANLIGVGKNRQGLRSGRKLPVSPDAERARHESRHCEQPQPLLESQTNGMRPHELLRHRL